MTPSTLHDLLQRYQQGTSTAAEKRLVENWYEQLGQERELNVTPEERETIRQALWHRLREQAVPTETPAVPARWQLSAVGPWLAAALLVLGLALGARQLWPVPAPSTNPRVAVASAWRVVANTRPTVLEVRLPDSSLVQLAPASRLRYPRRFGAAARPVHLVGKAFFRVHHDASRPFRVYTARLLTTVLGTSFSVEAYAARPAVVQVKSGRVQVSARPAADAPLARPAALVLLPNQQVVYSPGRPQLQRQLVAQPVQLRPQSFVFDDQPVADVLAALEQAYGVTIVADKSTLAGCAVTLALRNQSLYGKLDVLCQTLGASYEKVDTHILFHSPGCRAR